MVNATSGFPPHLTAALPLLAALCACGAQEATLTGESLKVSPCRDGKDLVLAPVDLSFNHLVWVRYSDQNGTLELRRGWRQPTASDLVSVEFMDLPLLREAVRQASGQPVAMEGLARVSLVLSERCPDADQPLVARTGTLVLDRFDLDPGGHIAGSIRFDLRDERQDPSEPPVGVNLALTFEKELTDKDPLTGYGR